MNYQFKTEPELEMPTPDTDFAENHSPLTTAIHKELSVAPYWCICHIPDNHVPYCQDYYSEKECKAAAVKCLKTAYDVAQSYVTPGNSRCISIKTAECYSEVIDRCFTPIIDSLRTYCEKANKHTIFEKLCTLLKQCKKNLQLEFEKELCDSSDYYSMYQFDYFVNQIEIEEHDYRINDEGFFRLLETLVAKNIEYTFSGCLEAIGEMSKDLQRNLTTFFNAAYKKYECIVKDFEFLIDSLGMELPEMLPDENIDAYIIRITAAL